MSYRSLALLALLTAVGCSAPQGDDGASAATDITAAPSCTPAYEDDAIVVYADHSYAPKQLHVTEFRVTPASPDGTSDWEGTRFYESHLEYDLTPRVSDDVLAHARASVHAEIHPATIVIDAKTAGTKTMLEPGASSFTTKNDGGTVTAELTDHFVGPLAAGAGPLLGGSLRKSMLLLAHANAKAGACNVALSSTAPVTFDVDVARVLHPGFEMTTLDTFVATGNSYRTGFFKSQLAEIDSPAVDAAFAKFADYTDRELRPVMRALSVSITHDDLMKKLDEAWAEFRAFAAVVLAETKSSVDIADLVVPGSFNTMSTNPKIQYPAVLLVFPAGAIKTDLEGARRDVTEGWSTRPLER